MPVIYTAINRFDSVCGERWQNFINWSGVTHLEEVISLDLILCPSVFEDLTAEDWEYNVQEDFRIHLFHDLDHVVRRVAGDKRLIVLALMENPTSNEVSSFTDHRFAFRGFDLVNHCCDISALLNCGGFDRAFALTDLSDCGLLTEYENALSVQDLRRVEYPDEHHADCDLWAIWQMKMGAEIMTGLSL